MGENQEQIVGEKSQEAEPYEPEFYYVARIAGYIAELPNGYVLSSKYEYYGPVILILQPTGKSLEEIYRQPVSGVREGMKEVWKVYQDKKFGERTSDQPKTQ